MNPRQEQEQEQEQGWVPVPVPVPVPGLVLVLVLVPAYPPQEWTLCRPMTHRRPSATTTSAMC